MNRKKKTPVRPVAKYRSLVTQNTNMIMAFVNSMRHPAEYGIPLNQMAVKYVHINMLLRLQTISAAPSWRERGTNDWTDS